MSNAVAQTIWQQISLNTKMACGAREARADGNSLTFRAGGKPMHFIKVTLDVSDTYTVEYFRIKRHTAKTASEPRVTLKSASDIYNDSLSETIYAFVNKE